jgi:hypothetical protein
MCFATPNVILDSSLKMWLHMSGVGLQQPTGVVNKIIWFATRGLFAMVIFFSIQETSLTLMLKRNMLRFAALEGLN